VDAGFNVHIEPAFYNLPLHPVPCRAEPNRPSMRLTIAGNINEALDLLAVDVEIPLPAEGDLIALLNAGGYGSSMSSDHCLRGRFSEYLII
jgi:diaminopimelate decarboxylase